MKMTYNYTQQYGKKALANTILNKKARNKIQYRQAKLIYVARSQTGRVSGLKEHRVPRYLVS